MPKLSTKAAALGLSYAVLVAGGVNPEKHPDVVFSAELVLARLRHTQMINNVATFLKQ
jgi:hypothetical protein